MSEPRYLLLRGSEDGNPLSFLTPGALQQLLDDPEQYAGVREFRSVDDVDRDPNYWRDGTGVLLRYEVVIPVPAGSYRLPDGE